MKVSELPYRRVTREEMTEGLQRVIERVKAAQSVEEILAARAEYLSLTTEYATAQSLSYMRYTINTVDPFYLAEKDYYDEIGPEVENLALQYTSAVLDSPFRKELETALSPMTVWTQDAWGQTGYQVPGVGAWYALPLFSLKVTIPGGPPGTVARKLYRFDYDYGMTESPALTPWGSAGGIGPVYDRHAHLVQTITAGDQTVDVDVYDEDTTLTFAGTRPPKPLVYLGPVAVQSPSSVHMTQPVNL